MSIKNILLVDDEENIRELFDTYLTGIGYTTRQVENSKDVENEIKKEKPDLVFLDIKMPGMDGVEVLKMIKNYDQDIPVVMISGFATEHMAKETLHIGAFDYIKKPVDLEKVSEIISCIDLLNFDI